MDWYIEAIDFRNREKHRIDRRWRQWGPAPHPLRNDEGEWKGKFERPEDCDERLYRCPDGAYVLTWRVDESTSYYASDYVYYCDYMTDAEAAAWFKRQGFEPPADVARLTTIRSVDEVSDEESEAARQCESANAQLSAAEELELLFPTVRPATDQAEAPAVEATPKRLWTREAAQPIVGAHLKKHPHATLREISAATGVSQGTVSNTPAWLRGESIKKNVDKAAELPLPSLKSNGWSVELPTPKRKR